MNIPKDKAEYFCTVGKGIESFCVQELQQMGTAEVIKTMIGKVFFNCSSPVNLLNLKTVERLFVNVAHCKQFLKYSSTINALYTLEMFIKKEITDWTDCFRKWELFQSLKYCNQSCVKVSQTVNVPNCSKNVTSSNVADCSEPAMKIARQEADSGSDKLRNVKVNRSRERYKMTGITFRVSCKCTGKMRQKLASQYIAKFIGIALAESQNWEICLKNPMLDISVHITDDSITIGIPVKSRPLSERNYLRHLPLRSTICYSMLMLANISEGAIVLDPMCGAGTILAEAAVNFPTCFVIGVDRDPLQLQKAQENFTCASCCGELMYGDVKKLPLLDNSVRNIVCDIPFGLKHGTVDEIEKLLPYALLEMNRVLLPGGNVVLLVSNELRSWLVHYLTHVKSTGNICAVKQKSSGSICCTIGHDLLQGSVMDQCHKYKVLDTSLEILWKKGKEYNVNLGELPAVICVFHKPIY